MAYLLHQLVEQSAQRSPLSPALLFKDQVLDYATLWHRIDGMADALAALGLSSDQRVAIYLPKQPETVVFMFAALAAGGVFVPVNPILKPEQVGHILRDCDVSVLVTSAARAALLSEQVDNSPALQHLILVDDQPVEIDCTLPVHSMDTLPQGQPRAARPRIDADLAAILYTSGSTGRPKGVVLSHANMLAGARSVAEYLHNTAEDRLLAVLPFSFDYGLSQLTTAFLVGASVVLMDYLLPRDVIRAVSRYGITGLAAVPPLWNQLAALEWPEEAVASLRYLTNSGGAMPVATTRALRAALPETQIYLMYGLTEAFRSTYLDPQLVDQRPDSMGKAIPNAQVMVVRPDGSECAVDEPGELVHRGALVAQGYWNDPHKTAQRFRPAPGQPNGLVNPEIAVWSGDQVRRDSEGFLYFIGRSDEMIKTSGYRVSPGEIEEVVLILEEVEQAVALGVPHPMLGHAIVLVAQARCTADEILLHCRAQLPLYMLPGHVELLDELPRNANGKIDRALLGQLHRQRFTD